MPPPLAPPAPLRRAEGGAQWRPCVKLDVSGCVSFRGEPETESPLALQHFRGLTAWDVATS